MKIAVTSQGNDMSSTVDPRFGRARRFIVVDLHSGAFEAVDNETNTNAMQGAGIQAASTVRRSGASAVLTGHCGPKACQSLQAAGIRVYTGASGTVAEAVDRFRNKELGEAQGPDVGGHWEPGQP